MHSKTTHERRQHALQVAGVVTGVFAIVWVATLGLRAPAEPTASNSTSQDTSQSASVASSLTSTDNAYLEVSTSSVLQNQ